MTEEVRKRLDKNREIQFSFLNLSLCNLRTLPEEIKDYEWLTFLNVKHNPDLSDISLVAELPNLTELHCGFTQVQDLSPIADLQGLTYLFVNTTRVSDLSPVSGLLNLEHLFCTDTQIRDLSPLSHLTKLKELSCSMLSITDLSPLSGLTHLERLWCHTTQVSDLSPILSFIQKGIRISLKESISKNEFTFAHCPLTHPPYSIVEQGNEAILQYFDHYK